MPINDYLKEIKNIYSRDANEHSYRTPLENLFNVYVGDKKIIQERTTDEGYPDFAVLDQNDMLIGFIECKDTDCDILGVINSNKKNKEYKGHYEQLLKYLTLADLVIFTNYTEFSLITKDDNGKIISLKDVKLCDDIENKKFHVIAGEDENLKLLFKELLDSKPQDIKSQDYFVSLLAQRAKVLRDYIMLDLGSEASYFRDNIKKLFDQTIFSDLDDKDFADAFAQIITFGLLFYRLSSKKNVDLSTFHSMPEYIPIFREFLSKFSLDDCSDFIRHAIRSIIGAVNAYDKTMFYNELSYKDVHDKEDPFIYMYESFLKEFDPKTRNARGVFYTPTEVVHYLVKSVDEILIHKLGLQNGLLNKNVHILDFATGTGTFLLGTIEYIYNEILKSNNEGLWKDEVSNFILKQLYGFEFLVVPYILAHFRIHEFLNACDYEYSKNERLRLYLTNTLDNTMGGSVAMFPRMNEEADMAYKVKNEEPVLVVMGNPPYNNKSDPMNSKTWITGLIEDYKKELSGTEKGSINDDYIKFIRFAHWKMEKVDKGIVSIIVNNSFISGISHKTMRKSLMNTFDEIYIFDLHGNMNKSEKCPDGTTDFNIFNIKDVGVCMVLLVKTGIKNNLNSGVYFQEIFGTQKYKKEFLLDKSIFTDKENNKWIKLEDDKKWHWFTSKKVAIEYWDNFISLKDIFENINSGVQTEKDTLMIHLEEASLDKALKDITNLEVKDICEKYNLKNSNGFTKIFQQAKEEIINKEGIKTKIHYRPFDFRHIYYTSSSNGCIGRPRYSIMKNFINKENIGLIFPRQVVGGYGFEHGLVSNYIIDRAAGGAKTGSETNFAPLYIYDENTDKDLSFDEEKHDNFTTTFKTFLKTYHTDDAYKILSYIYAVLYAPTYRKKYKEDLAYDYPRIFFTDSKEVFDSLVSLGDKLINLHLLKTPPKTNHGYPIAGEHSVSKPRLDNQKLYINDTQYFDNVCDEVFSYSIGGYQVIMKYLKSREVLSLDDIKHIQNIIAVIQNTILIQNDIDKVYKSKF